MSEYTIKTDDGQFDCLATSADDAVQQYAASERETWQTVEEFFDAIRAIDGAWAWIEGEDFDRVTA